MRVCVCVCVMCVCVCECNVCGVCVCVRMCVCVWCACARVHMYVKCVYHQEDNTVVFFDPNHTTYIHKHIHHPTDAYLSVKKHVKGHLSLPSPQGKL